MPYKNSKKLRNFMFGSAGCSLLRAEGFSCSLDILYGGLGISKLQFLSAVIFLNFWSSEPLIRIGTVPIQPKLLDPDPESVNLDPKHWFMIFPNIQHGNS
jgi:hypothetical protein